MYCKISVSFSRRLTFPLIQFILFSFVQECLGGQDILTLRDGKGEVKLVLEYSTARRGSGEFVMNRALHLLYCIYTSSLIKARLHSHGEEKVQNLNLEKTVLSSTGHQGFAFIKADVLPTDTDMESIPFHSVFVVSNGLTSSEYFKLRQNAFPDEHIHEPCGKTKNLFSTQAFL